MSFSIEEIKELETHFDERYVLQSDCNEVQSKTEKRFANDDKRIDLMACDIKQMRAETKNSLKLNNWLTTAVLGCIIVGIVTFFYFNFGG